MITQEEIDQFVLWYECNNITPTPNGCATVTAPNNATLNTIYSWPGTGNVQNGEAAKLAPFFDRDADGIYNPDKGDHPVIKGCKAIYMIQNDSRRIKSYSGSPAMGLEIHTQFYQYRTWDELNDVTFVEVKAINRGGKIFSDIRSGIKLNGSAGNYDTDLMGCDSTKNLMYVYSDTNAFTLASQTITNPPAFGVIALDKPVSSIAPSQSFSNGKEWNLMKGLKGDGSSWKTPQGVDTKYVFHEPPANRGDWSTPNGSSSDLFENQMLMFSNHGQMLQGDTISQTYALLFNRDGNNIQNAQNMGSLASTLKTFFQSSGDKTCTNGILGLEEKVKSTPDFKLYPNPSAGQFVVANSFATYTTIEIRNMDGRLIQSLNSQSEFIEFDLTNESNGVYLVSLKTTSGQQNLKLILNK